MSKEPYEHAFVPKEWLGETVVIELDLPQWVPTSDLAVGQSPAAAMQNVAPVWPQMLATFVGEMSESLVFKNSERPLGFALLKGRIHSVTLVKSKASSPLVTK